MSQELYYSLVDVAISQYNVDLLTKLWSDTCMLDKSLYFELRERIVSKIPDLCKAHGILSCPSSFEEFVKEYDETLYERKYKGKNTSKRLKRAAREGNWRDIRRTLAYSFDENNSNNWNKALYGAAQSGNQDVIDFFLLQSRLFSKRMSNGEVKEAYNWQYGMYGAARSGNLELVKFFNSLPMPPYDPTKGCHHFSRRMNDRKPRYWNCGLYNAAKGGSIECIEFFSENGAEKNCGLYGAAREGRIGLVKAFIDGGATKKGHALYRAARGGHLQVVEYLFDGDSQNFNFGVQGAAHGGHLEIVKFFARSPSDHRMVAQPSIDGNHISVENGNVNYSDLMHAAARRSQVHIIEFLITCIPNLAEKEYEYIWNRGLYGAASGGHLELFKFFAQPPSDHRMGLKKGAKNLTIALSEAIVHKGTLEVVTFILSIIDNKKFRGRYLYSSVRTKKLDLVKFFVSQMEDSGSVDVEVLRTALCIAEEYEQVTVNFLEAKIKEHTK